MSQPSSFISTTYYSMILARQKLIRKGRNNWCCYMMMMLVQVILFFTMIDMSRNGNIIDGGGGGGGVTALTISKGISTNNNGMKQYHNKVGAHTAAVTSMMMITNEDIPDPSTFREAEVLGLRLMQEENFEDALVVFRKGMKLPGTRPDVVRTKSTSGPSPVGGSYGGTDSKRILSLDDFELQAVYYNMACAHSRLGNISESVANLENAFKIGFTNFSTVRGDPDLDPIKQDPDFDKLMESYDGGKSSSNDDGFNPFGLFSKSKK